jgi:hypothetical protein
MSDAKRLYNVMRGYIGREWDRLKELEREMAMNELDASGVSETPASPQPDARPAKVVIEIPEGSDPKDAARRILGVDGTADFVVVQKAYLRLSKRSLPSSMPNGSEEQMQAEMIYRRVQWAYQTLTADTPAIEKRFGSLEVD